MLIYHRFEVFLLPQLVAAVCLSSWALSVDFQLTTRKPVKAAGASFKRSPTKKAGKREKERGEVGL